MSCIAFIEHIEYLMNIEADADHSDTQVVEGLNAGRYELRGDKTAIIEKGTDRVVAHVGTYETTAAGVERSDFLLLAERG